MNKQSSSLSNWNKENEKLVWQHYISVMQAEWLKLSILAPKKLRSGRTVNCSETRTTLVLDRCASGRAILLTINRAKWKKTY